MKVCIIDKTGSTVVAEVFDIPGFRSPILITGEYAKGEPGCWWMRYQFSTPSDPSELEIIGAGIWYTEKDYQVGTKSIEVAEVLGLGVEAAIIDELEDETI